MSEIVFEEFPKISRWSRSVFVTEKIDGTNAQVYVLEDGTVVAGSRNRFLTLDADNYGFAKWVKEHEDELRTLGPGRHFGEWWGLGIQRTYGLQEKRFSLFNVGRWRKERPACCDVVPVLNEFVPGADRLDMVEGAIDYLRINGSVAAPGFMKPEGIVIYHSASRTMFKKTLERDEQPKSMSATEAA